MEGGWYVGYAWFIMVYEDVAKCKKKIDFMKFQTH